jgi:arabinogalactan endo-1,4-beta-galactosidase
MARRNFILSNVEPSTLNPNSIELAKVLVTRIGLMPRKVGSTEEMYKTLIELYERTKLAMKEKKPELAVMTVEEMGNCAGITRQTMYDYLKRWIDLDIITKTSYIYESKVIIGYRLNGNTLEQSFEKAAVRIKNNLEITLKYVGELQRALKNEKLSESMKEKNISDKKNPSEQKIN